MNEEYLDTEASPSCGQLWFLAGFCVVFVLLMFKMSSTWNPQGAGIMRCPMWQRYVIDVKRLFMPQMLGSSSESGFVTLILFLMHLGLSSVGGLISIGIGAIVRRGRS